MSEQRRRLLEDRMMRDTAKRLVSSDYRHLKGDLRERGLGSRVAGRMREGAEGLADDAKRFADDNTGSVGAGFALATGAVLAWIFRDELSDAFDRLWHGKPPSLTDRISEQTSRLTRWK